LPPQPVRNVNVNRPYPTFGTMRLIDLSRGASSYNGLNLYFEHRPDKTLPEGKTEGRLISQRSGWPIATVFEESLVSETVH
jgi:hypothetical protein